MPEVAIIGGTGVYNPDLLEDAREIIQVNEYGEVKITVGLYQGREVAFIPRHGAGHSVPPHLINYRANIKALAQVGVKNIIATAAVGSLCEDYRPGDFVLADQFVDFTHARQNTFFTGGDKGVVHRDMTVPYCPEIRQIIYEMGRQMNLSVHNGGVYVCTEGPRFETAAEIQMFKILGGSVIGMTSVPEVCLARELGICYANVSIVTNFAAGISPGILTHEEVLEIMRNTRSQVRGLLFDSIINIPASKNCDCARSSDELEVTSK